MRTRFSFALTITTGFAFFLLVSSMAHAQPQETVSDSGLRSLIDELWEFDLQESPLRATNVGDHRFDDQLGQVSVADATRRNQTVTEFSERLAKIIASNTLNDGDSLNADILQRLLKQRLSDFKFEQFYTPITNRGGFHVDFPELPKKVPLKTAEEYRNYISRLNHFKRLADQHVEIMSEGMKKGHSLPGVVLDGYEETITSNIVEDAKDSLLFEPFREFPEGISESDRKDLRKAGLAAINDSVLPGYRAFHKFMAEEYIPKARDTIAASALPNGREFYRYCVKRYTTLDLLPEEVHETGKREVARIREEMLGIMKKVEFDGELSDFLEHLRTDEKFYAKTPDELLRETAFTLKKIDGLLPRLFKTLPRTPYGVRVIPEYIAPKTTTAYYMPPRGDGSEAGFYYVNTYNLKSRPLYEIQALSLHEAVPGHHLQIALQQELGDVPQFRRFGGFTAYIEGWALYAERLGLEVGFYEDPYDDFGRLTYEMWRACRLVVDTGMHYLGWTRQQAIEFMEQNSALSKHNIRSEVDRYISWPGQALGYKIGELKIRELRKTAEEKLGKKFDIRDFHDVVLLSGAVPLDILENRVNAWIEKSR